MIPALIAVLGLLLALLVFVRSDASTLAAVVRIGAPLALAVGGTALLLLGQAGVGGVLIAGAFAWWGWQRNRPKKAPPRLRRSTVRTAALEMELDPRSGALSGTVLAGRHTDRVLAALSLAELVELREEVRSDRESLQLLHAYLESRFPSWREHADADDSGGEGGPPSPRAMSKQEAYQVLGLETGAGAADIRQAHRRLLKRLHPRLGASPVLAALINEAKDVLLSDHD